MALSKIDSDSLNSGAVTSAAIAAGSVASTALASGVPTRAQLPAGSVLQVLQAFKTDTTTLAVSSFTDIPSLEVTITPSSTSSKILIMTSVQATVYQLTVQFRITRNGTAVGVANAAGSRVQTLMGGLYNSVDANHQNNPFASSFLDSPASTSALTYRIQIKAQSGASAYINRSGNDSDNSDWAMRSTSNITVMEIAG
jgi:hypothetical protein